MTALLLAIFRGVWAIEPKAAEAYMPLVAALIKGERSIQELLPPTKNLSYVAANFQSSGLVSPNWRYGFSAPAQPGSVALVPVTGVITKYDGPCGEPGTQTISGWYNQIEANPNIIGSIMLIDSPGGQADGTGPAAEKIRATSKPKVGLTDGMMCSAAMWLGSANKEIYAGYKTDIIGSIGTYCTLYDWSGYLEQLGIKQHDIYASDSTDKNKMFADALAGNYGPIRTEILNPLNNAFKSAIKANRYGNGVKKEALTGKTFMPDQAQQMGLIDGIGNIDFAIQRVKTLAA